MIVSRQIKLFNITASYLKSAALTVINIIILAHKEYTMAIYILLFCQDNSKSIATV